MDAQLEKYRSEFPITGKFVYLNHAAVSAPSSRVTHAVEFLMHQISHDGIIHYPEWIKRIEAVRERFAQLINAKSRETAFIGNTSQGISMIASGIQWNKGDRVLIPRPEFPANVYPWKNLERHGVEIVFLDRRKGRFEIKDIEKALHPNAKLLSVSSVDFMTGYRCDLEELGHFCEAKGLLFCVDAIQSLGVIPLDVKKSKIHFLAAGGHKWLMSTMGCGALYISEDANDKVHPEQVGWKSVNDPENFFQKGFDLQPDATRFEPGTMNLPGIYALGAAMDLLTEAGIENIFNKVKRINDLFYSKLNNRGLEVPTSMDGHERSGILSFVPKQEPVSLFRYLMKNNIMVSERAGMIRLSPHFYNNEEDVARFFEVLDEYK